MGEEECIHFSYEDDDEYLIFKCDLEDGEECPLVNPCGLYEDKVLREHKKRRELLDAIIDTLERDDEIVFDEVLLIQRPPKHTTTITENEEQASQEGE